MAKQEKQLKKVLYIFGNEQEFGQTLSNLIGLNPDLVIHHQFSTSTVRQKAPNAIAVPGQNNQPQFEAVIMCYIVYSNPGELVFMAAPEPGQDDQGKVKAKIIN